jgi:hypothetical protein
MTGTWPTGDLDTLARLRALAAGVRGATVVEGRIPAPFDVVWPVMADLEGGFGRFQTDMRQVKVESVDGDRVIALARSRLGFRARLRGVLRPGWCWLQSRFLLIGMAAVADGDSTRVAVTGGVRLPGRAAVVPVGTRRELQHVLDRLAAQFPR